jgi:hypothetical protein
VWTPPSTTGRPSWSWSRRGKRRRECCHLYDRGRRNIKHFLASWGCVYKLRQGAKTGCIIILFIGIGWPVTSTIHVTSEEPVLDLPVRTQKKRKDSGAAGLEHRVPARNQHVEVSLLLAAPDTSELFSPHAKINVQQALSRMRSSTIQVLLSLRPQALFQFIKK